MAVRAGHWTAKWTRNTYFAFQYICSKCSSRNELCMACSLSCLVRWFAGETSVALEAGSCTTTAIYYRKRCSLLEVTRAFIAFLFVCLSVCLSVMSSVVHQEETVRRPDFFSRRKGLIAWLRESMSGRNPSCRSASSQKV